MCAQWVTKDPSFLHADRKDSDQIELMPSLITVFTVHSVGNQDPSFFHADNEDSDQTELMTRLIRVFT